MTEYLLPDGEKIMLGREKYLAPEILFQPKMIGLEYEGIHELLANCIKKADIDLRQKLNMKRALEGELMRTINQFPNVQNSRVHLTIPQSRLFQKEDGGKASAVSYTHLTLPTICSV